MKNMPLVSIVMNCFNGADYLENALNSVINQTYKNWELIFWDNNSTDNSYEIFKKFKDSRFKYFKSNQHTILYQARNEAIKKTSGEFISFLDTDDIWLSDKLEKQIPLFNDDEVGLVYGNCWIHNKKNFFKSKKIFSKKKLSKGIITKHLLNDYKVGLLTILIRKKFIENIDSTFDTKYDLLADFDFVIKFSLKHKFDCIQEPIAIYRRHENQLQRKFFEKQLEQMENWFIKTKNNSQIKSYGNLDVIKNKINYMKIINLIEKKEYMSSFYKIIKFPFNTNKFKLLLIFVLPNIILKHFRDYT